MHLFGQSRSASQRDHLLQTPDSFVRTPVPQIQRGTAIVHVSPATGAGFTQYTAELESGGKLTACAHQRLVYVLEGAVDLASPTSFHTLGRGGYAYLPAGSTSCTFSASTAARLVVIEKPYQPLAGTPHPTIVVGDEATLPSAPLLDDADLQVRHLLPDQLAFDFAVNTMTYQPGASLSQVEIHVMEHGLLMLQGGGIYRLGERWYSVTAGDFIWMAPFCPQWFAAIGKQPSKYLIYKDTNRHPLE